MRVHRTLQVRILEWVVFPFSRGSSQPRDRTRVSRIVDRFFTSWARREAQETGMGSLYVLQGIFPAQELNRDLLTAGRFFTSWAMKEVQEPHPVTLGLISIVYACGACETWSDTKDNLPGWFGKYWDKYPGLWLDFLFCCTHTLPSLNLKVFCSTF